MRMKPRAAIAVAGTTLLAGFVGGMVISGRLALTSSSNAQSMPPAPTQASRPAATFSGNALPDLSSVAEAALKVSVNITSTTIIQAPSDPMYRYFYGTRAQESQSLGSGVVVSPDGYILTNKHVIGNAGADVRVTLPDGTDRPARLVGLDDVSDLAVVKVEAQNLKTLPWGDSTRLRVAEWVLAIGNPFQLSGTVTLGIISSVSRSAEQMGGYQDFIQTDAAINPGNSGGALVNARGELVGINTMIFSETGGYQGIGFAIPATFARGIMTELIQNGTIIRGSIGSVDFYPVTEGTPFRGDVLPTGAFVRSISASSSAYRAGLAPGDTVTAVNGQRITTPDQINRLVVQQKVGSTLKLTVTKRGGREATIDVPVVARQQTTGRAR